MPACLSATSVSIEPLFALRHKPDACCVLRLINVRGSPFLPAFINEIEVTYATYSFCPGSPME
jgi:hypothetical protein